MSRKIPRQVWRGDRKDSNTRNGHQENECYKEEDVAGPPSRTRARLKRKLQQQQPPPKPIPANTNKPKHARKKLNHQHHESSKTNDKIRLSDKTKKSPKTDIYPTSTGGDQSSAVASSSLHQPLPQKHILELLLDTLQRRDTYEIFAEPVDPKEVEDYYEIIKEPMDFGTMRAKLHEGMYTTLEQFEHDVFLISGNAMHFNSSATTFFKQARAIHELSKKVFDSLRSDPQNFVMEYSGTRRRSSRRLQGEEKKSNYYKSITKHSADARTNNATVDASSSSVKASSIFGNLGAARARDFGARRCRSPDQADRRCTYKPMLLHGNNLFVSGGDLTNSKTLVPVNQQEDVSYRESLMRFVKDLGPTAEMIANRKLQGLYDPGDCISQPAQTPASFPFPQKSVVFYPTPAVPEQTSASWVSKSIGNSSLISSPNDIGLSKQRLEKAIAVPVMTKSSKDSSKESSYTEPKTKQVVSGFAFDLPFLKSRLNQMKFNGNLEEDDNRFLFQTKPQLAVAAGRNQKMKSLSFGKKLKQKGWPFCNNPDADLALQL